MGAAGKFYGSCYAKHNVKCNNVVIFNCISLYRLGNNPKNVSGRLSAFLSTITLKDNLHVVFLIQTGLLFHVGCASE
jgi:hypothetical protein